MALVGTRLSAGCDRSRFAGLGEVLAELHGVCDAFSRSFPRGVPAAPRPPQHWVLPLLFTLALGLLHF